MSEAESKKLGQMQAVASALKQAAKAAWDIGKLKDACDLYHRADIAESRAFEYELELRYPDEDMLAHYFGIGRPLL